MAIRSKLTISFSKRNPQNTKNWINKMLQQTQKQNITPQEFTQQAKQQGLSVFYKHLLLER